MEQTSLDRLTLFVATADEMQHEPFFSEDVHESIQWIGQETTPHVKMMHPSFLKSAILPFRKLWMTSEHSCFAAPKQQALLGVRKIVFDWYFQNPPLHKFDTPTMEAYKRRFVDRYDWLLEQPPQNPEPEQHLNETIRQIIDIWINTEIAHVGPKLGQKKGLAAKQGRVDFDQWCSRIGRERFEYYFRTSIRDVACEFIEFSKCLAKPLLEVLTQGQNLKPSFEAEFALKYNPYLDARYKVQYRDYFWHLDKESPAETLERILSRTRFSVLFTFLKQAFPKRSAAASAVEHSRSFDDLITEHQIVCSPSIDPPDSAYCGSSRTVVPPSYKTVSLAFYRLADDRLACRLDSTSESILSDLYLDLREVFLSARVQQRKPVHEDKWKLSAWSDDD